MQDPFRWDFVGKNVAFMAVEGFIYFTLNLLIQYRFFLNRWCESKHVYLWKHLSSPECGHLKVSPRF